MILIHNFSQIILINERKNFLYITAALWHVYRTTFFHSPIHDLHSLFLWQPSFFCTIFSIPFTYSFNSCSENMSLSTKVWYSFIFFLILSSDIRFSNNFFNRWFKASISLGFPCPVTINSLRISSWGYSRKCLNSKIFFRSSTLLKLVNQIKKEKGKKIQCYP
jgi:hypothetical protein